MIKKSDFVLAPYMKSNDLRAAYQVLNTVVPYILLWFLAARAAEFSLFLLPPIMVLIVLFSLRCFSLMHDCGHYSLFRSKRVNRVVGFILGVINAIPQYPWSRGHAYHHKTNGDWEKYRGPSALISTEQFAKLSPSGQNRYELLRHPLMLFPGGFFYLAIKPRLVLIAGLYGFIGHLLTCIQENPSMDIKEIIYSYKSRNWYTAGEFVDILFNNICVVGIWIYLGYLLGFGFFFGVYSITLTFSAAIFICIFFVQHNFDGSYAHKTEGWDYTLGALEGSSYLELPTVLKWFGANIGYHNIHHLSERIPNYNLEACHNENGHLLTHVKKLKIADIPDCFQFILWDASTDSLVSIASFRQSTVGGVNFSLEREAALILGETKISTRSTS
ncbi:fatty acid desaturase [Aphanizomenon flos-aquae FACHB-1416]|uniref:Fatty acid desaturase n=2 Tax=Aphanizomenonaceae TaxID=1892259 RepID=A0ABR8IPQ3_APHFL|nr:fatty acid desaturase [Aphanizomenon flos-aquae FACHB-1171]MBD2555750.1 fatty acid desaturase [Aphanizomenon flos-aquae FACHB-1290]MBD2630523.1 fatty acid desaturase [Aphanizomenon sp. FACHB-1399]MBD2641839.1 fatty acid desaturase [Aphanizomenon sp. FACHB-1401]MBD2656337.1 fatty acid desaturase [Aphanizomenon flos-aquae FACHB-1265]MBD2675382.1 fatty acid desaturase [Aphanizomenon flos-aquae FACHB-1416]MBD2684861.1 fatty acid desaturase [Aphanizomenon flos-aquae FACHB-1249]MBD2696137.1 fat